MWIEGQKPPWHKVRSVLLDALCGLAHLHDSMIIHGDVKPANMLVDDRERGALADFDISIDFKERTSAAAIKKRMATMSMHAPALGMTLDYAAPELLSSREVTTHTDMFAYGKSI